MQHTSDRCINFSKIGKRKRIFALAAFYRKGRQPSFLHAPVGQSTKGIESFGIREPIPAQGRKAIGSSFYTHGRSLRIAEKDFFSLRVQGHDAQKIVMISDKIAQRARFRLAFRTLAAVSCGGAAEDPVF